MLIPVFRGELGVKVHSHVPAVHALPGRKIVEIEEGEEALYPSADEWRVVPRVADGERRGHPKLPGHRRARFVPLPFIEPEALPPADVVICPRVRDYVETRNWLHWAALADELQARGVGVIAAGAPDSSARVPCPVTWEWPRFLDATIRAMLDARLVIATDAGLAHLAILCGRPLLIITHRGRAASGPRVLKDGRTPTDRPHWYVNVPDYYEAANHRGAPIRLIDAWHDPAPVAGFAAGFLQGEDPPGFRMPPGFERDMAGRLP